MQAGKTLRKAKSIPDALGGALLAQVDAAATDVRTLRHGVRCPDDAPAAS